MRITKAQARRIGNKLKVKWCKVDLEQFRLGLQAELEHRDVTKGNLTLTGKIALAHLREMPDYYTRLKRMESKRR